MTLLMEEEPLSGADANIQQRFSRLSPSSPDDTSPRAEAALAQPPAQTHMQNSASQNQKHMLSVQDEAARADDSQGDVAGLDAEGTDQEAASPERSSSPWPFDVDPFDCGAELSEGEDFSEMIENISDVSPAFEAETNIQQTASQLHIGGQVLPGRQRSSEVTTVNTSVMASLLIYAAYRIPCLVACLYPGAIVYFRLGFCLLQCIWQLIRAACNIELQVMKLIRSLKGSPLSRQLTNIGFRITA